MMPAAGFYRILWPAAQLQADGHDIDVIPPDRSVPALSATVQDGRVVSVRHPGVDVLVFQRPMMRLLCDAIPLLQELGVAVVVEVDDDFTSLPPTNVAFAGNHPRRDPDCNWGHLSTAARLADLVVVTTPALAQRYGRPGRARVVPNFLPAFALQPPGEPNAPLVLGWSGTLRNHTGDLNVTRGAVARVAASTGTRVRVIGPTDEALLLAKALGLPSFPEVTGWIPIGDYPAQLARLDVGIVPLAGNRFNMSKSRVKGLEMAGVGVPFVATPTPEYQALAAHGVGRLAAKPKDWTRELRRLLTDAPWRAEVAAAGRAYAATQTVEANAWRFWEAWTDAASLRRAGLTGAAR